METIIFIAIILAAYLLGSVPSAVWIGRIFFNTDVRNSGSGNAGATNAIRVLGWQAGIAVFVMDLLKGWVAVQLVGLIPARMMTPDQYTGMRILAAIAVVSGHIFPVFARFRGGKGVATLVGVGIALFPLALPVAACIFFLILLTSGYVSLASIITSIAFPFLVFLLFPPDAALLKWFSVLIAIFIPLTHRKNIVRLMKGEESRFIGRKKNPGTGEPEK